MKNFCSHSITLLKWQVVIDNPTKVHGLNMLKTLETWLIKRDRWILCWICVISYENVWIVHLRFKHLLCIILVILERVLIEGLWESQLWRLYKTAQLLKISKIWDSGSWLNCWPWSGAGLRILIHSRTACKFLLFHLSIFDK